MCHQVWLKAVRSDNSNTNGNLPSGVETIPKGRGLQYLQKWSKIDIEKKKLKFQQTIQSTKKKSNDMYVSKIENNQM